MALVMCPECGAGVSEKALACPRCGCPLREPDPAPVAPAAATEAPARQRRGWGFEWRTRAEILGWPLVHVAVGRNPQTGRLRVAKGIIAVGQIGIGLITVAQLGVGILFALGQLVGGYVAIGQGALGLRFGLGQFACGMTAIGQFAFGKYVLAQAGAGKFVWSTRLRDPEAVQHFQNLWGFVKGLLGR